jgi:glycosyltransferase involved in cell wall biosynthesis
MLTVLIATYNGARTLPKALDAYLHLQSPAEDWKLVIVDNGSSDETTKIIDSFKGRLPLTYIFEPLRGKNVALNSGLSRVEGDLVLLTDDDVVPKLDWLIEMRRAADSQPSFSIFGGAIVPHWEIQPQNWIFTSVPMAAVFALTNPSQLEGPVAPDLVFGCNMGIRSKIFRCGYRFNPEIGPCGKHYAMGSETELTLRLAEAGFKSWHCPRSVVAHIVRKSQINRKWILGRARKLGRGQYRLNIQFKHAHSRSLLGIPRSLISHVVREIPFLAHAVISGDSMQMFQKRWDFNFLIGQAMEARILHRQRQSSNSRPPGLLTERRIESVPHMENQG